MHDLHSRRWNPGFVAMRWRHVFWILPAAGLLAAFTFLAIRFAGRNTVSGVVQIRTGRVVEISPSGFAASFREGAIGLRSDEVLRSVAAKENLPARWNADVETCVARLRENITMRQIRDTALIEVSVKGRSPAEAEDLWMTLVEAANGHFAKLREEFYLAPQEEVRTNVQILEAEVEAQRQALSDQIRFDDLVHRPPGSLAEKMKVEEFQLAKSEFEGAVRNLEKARMALLSDSQGLPDFREGPVLVHEEAKDRTPTTLWETVRPLVLSSGIGVGSGMILSVILAYLLELVFPRQRTGEIANSV